MNENKFSLPLPQQHRRGKFQRRCSVTEHTLRAARHVRELLHREDCLHRHVIVEERENDAVPELVELSSDHNSSEATQNQLLVLADESKCTKLKTSWRNDRPTTACRNDSLLALATPFLLHEEQWENHHRVNFHAGNDDLQKESRKRRSKTLRSLHNLEALERDQKKPKIEEEEAEPREPCVKRVKFDS